MSLRLRLNLVLLGCFGIGLLGAAGYYWLETQQLANEALEYEARLHMRSAMAVREFTIENVKPHFDAAGPDAFIPGAVPAFAARRTLEILYREYPGYTYREAALNPTNPSDQARGWERDLIERFRDGRLHGEQLLPETTPAGRVLHVVRPVVISDPACLRCHGDGAAAPGAMQRLYPGGGGFSWKMGETVGAQIVTVPFEVQARRAHVAFERFLVALLAVFGLLAVALNVLLSRVVLLPLSAANQALDRLADTDALTGAHNRRGLDRAMRRAMDEPPHRASALSVIAFDLDHFKRVNDRFGHEAGDDVLRRASFAVRQRLRHQDVLARVGGEEFVVVLPGTDVDGAQRIAEDLRLAVRASIAGEAGPVTASFGAALWDGTETAQALLARADAVLYDAKRDGRDRVRLAASPRAAADEAAS